MIWFDGILLTRDIPGSRNHLSVTIKNAGKNVVFFQTQISFGNAVSPSSVFTTTHSSLVIACPQPWVDSCFQSQLMVISKNFLVPHKIPHLTTSLASVTNLKRLIHSAVHLNRIRSSEVWFVRPARLQKCAARLSRRWLSDHVMPIRLIWLAWALRASFSASALVNIQHCLVSFCHHQIGRRLWFPEMNTSVFGDGLESHVLIGGSFPESGVPHHLSQSVPCLFFSDWIVNSLGYPFHLGNLCRSNGGPLSDPVSHPPQDQTTLYQSTKANTIHCPCLRMDDGFPH